MKKYLKKLITGDPKYLLKTYPFSIISLAALTIFALYISSFNGNENVFDQHDSLGKIMVYLIIAPITFLAISQTVRGLKLNYKFNTAANTIAAILLIPFVLTLVPKTNENPHQGNIYIFFTLCLFLIAMSLVGNLLRNRDPLKQWKYIEEFIRNYALVQFFTLILFTGLSLAILSLDVLLNFKFDEVIYFRLFIILNLFIGHILFLSTIPKDSNKTVTAKGYYTIYKIFGLYVLTPLILIYSLILYAFGIKILATGDWPENQVSYLILSFLFPGFLALLLLYPLNTKLYFRIKKIAGLVFIPLIILLLLAIRLRVKEFGFTQERLYLIIFSIWLLCLCMYLVLKTKIDLRVVFLSLPAIIFVSTIFPFINVNSLSVDSQFGRLVDKLESLNIIEEEKINTEKVFKISAPEYYDISSYLYFLYDNDSAYKLKEIVSETDWKEIEKLTQDSSYTFVGKTLDILNIQDNSDREVNLENFIFYSSKDNVIYTKGYDYAVPFDDDGITYISNQTTQITSLFADFYITSKDNRTFSIRYGSEVIFESTDQLFKNVVTDFIDDGFDDSNYVTLDLRHDDLDFTYSKEGLGNFKIDFRYLDGYIDSENSSLGIRQFKGYILYNLD